MVGRTSYQSLIAIPSIELCLTHFISLSPQFETSFILIYNAGDKLLLDNSVYTHMYTKLFANSFIAYYVIK